jgi:hypothetical protein
MTTAKRPIPKREIVANLVSDQIIAIRASSEDARQWIEQEAAQFGSLHVDTWRPGGYMLFVYAEYEPKEVHEWLRDGYYQFEEEDSQ